MKKVFEQEMIWVVFGLLVLNLLFPKFYSLGTWDLNRTIGWGWDWPNPQSIWWLQNSFILLLITFLIGYGWVKFTNRQANFYLSFFHFLTLILGFFIFPNVVYLLLVVGLFIINLLNTQRLEGF